MVVLPSPDSPNYQAAVKKARAEETKRRRAFDRQERYNDMVEALERRLDIGHGERWVRGCEEWEQAAGMFREQRYRKALDRLQVLIVSRLLQLAKANMAGTGELVFAELRWLTTAG
jgi:hypothetical protein